MVQANEEMQDPNALPVQKIVDETYNKLAGGSDVEKSMAGIYSAIWAQKCTFCGGPGHTAKQCPFKKNIDRSFQNAPLMRKLWGNLKSSKRRDGVQIAIKTKAIKDIE